MERKFWRENFHLTFPFPALIFPKNGEFPGTPEQPFPGHSKTGTTLDNYNSNKSTNLFARNHIKHNYEVYPSL